MVLDIIECMATSDNVVRAGLTPKLRDVPTLIEMLTYQAGPGSKQLLTPTSFNRGEGEGADDTSTTLYDPPIDEFSVLKIELKDGGSTRHRAIAGPSLCVVTEGKARIGWEGGRAEDVVRGDVVFVGAGTVVEWVAEGGLEVFRAFVEVGGK